MSDEEDDTSRLFAPCPDVASEYGAAELVATCDFDGRFYARCCFHVDEICHHNSIVYTDGASSNNPKFGAVSGIGVACGTRKGNPIDKDTTQFFLPVDDSLDPGGRRTSQRAELLAALEGLKKVCDHEEERVSDDFEVEEDDECAAFKVIITTHSEYVVKGMTEWLPNWKDSEVWLQNNQRPLDFDLFTRLDAEVEERERRHRCQVRFWHIDGEYSTLAHQLAKQGACAAAQLANEALGEVISAVGALCL